MKKIKAAITVLLTTIFGFIITCTNVFAEETIVPVDPDPSHNTGIGLFILMLIYITSVLVIMSLVGIIVDFFLLTSKGLVDMKKNIIKTIQGIFLISSDIVFFVYCIHFFFNRDKMIELAWIGYIIFGLFVIATIFNVVRAIKEKRFITLSISLVAIACDLLIGILNKNPFAIMTPLAACIILFYYLSDLNKAMYRETVTTNEENESIKEDSEEENK